jgi:formate transporter
MEGKLLTPAEIYAETIYVGVKKGKNHSLQTLILGILAGVFVSFGAYASSMASHSIENPGIAKLVAGVVFPVGLMLVLICGGELFTGNTLMSVAFMEKKITLKQMVKNWTIVYFANFIGAVFIAFLIFTTGLLDTNSGKLGGYAIKIAANKANLNFTQAFVSGILCNIIVCLSVWGSYAAKDVAGKVLMAFFPILAFVIMGFEHSVANMYYFSIGLMSKMNPSYVEASHVTADKLSKLDLAHVIGNLVPVTLGNIIGGAVFVGIAYWGVYRFAAELNKNVKKTVGF